MSEVRNVSEQINRLLAGMDSDSRERAGRIWEQACKAFRADYPDVARETAMQFAELRFLGFCSRVLIAPPEDATPGFVRSAVRPAQIGKMARYYLVDEHLTFNQYARKEDS